MKSTRLALLIAFAFMPAAAMADDSGFASSHSLRKEKGKLCMSEHLHLGTADGATRAAAKTNAIKTWEKYTGFEYGSDWARYSRAAPVSIEYTKADKGWTAVVTARPCK
jgi:hypothetical protein